MFKTPNKNENPKAPVKGSAPTNSPVSRALSPTIINSNSNNSATRSSPLSFTANTVKSLLGKNPLLRHASDEIADRLAALEIANQEAQEEKEFSQAMEDALKQFELQKAQADLGVDEFDVSAFQDIPAPEPRRLGNF